MSLAQIQNDLFALNVLLLLLHTESRYLSRHLHSILTLPAVGMCSGMRVTIAIHLVGHHGIQHPWILFTNTHMQNTDDDVT